MAQRAISMVEALAEVACGRKRMAKRQADTKSHDQNQDRGRGGR